MFYSSWQSLSFTVSAAGAWCSKVSTSALKGTKCVLGLYTDIVLVNRFRFTLVLLFSLFRGCGKTFFTGPTLWVCSSRRASEVLW